MTLQCAYSNLQYDKYAHTNHNKDSTNTKKRVKYSNVRRPKVVTAAHSSVRPIVTLAVIFENSFVEARRIILKVSTIQRSKVFMRKTSKIALFMEEG